MWNANNGANSLMLIGFEDHAESSGSTTLPRSRRAPRLLTHRIWDFICIPVIANMADVQYHCCDRCAKGFTLAESLGNGAQHVNRKQSDRLVPAQDRSTIPNRTRDARTTRQDSLRLLLECDPPFSVVEPRRFHRITNSSFSRTTISESSCSFRVLVIDKIKRELFGQSEIALTFDEWTEEGAL
jgi:hypothetical protein